ncbi:unnamed protein product, partial [Aphis gossypii]
DLKKKWNNVRDSYRKYKRKTKQSSGAGAKKTKKYLYANFLDFLDSTFEQRQTDSNYYEGNDINNQSICSDQSNDVVSPTETNSKQKKVDHKKTTKRTRENEEAQTILDFIKQKSKSEDEDYYFAMSLIPEIKRVPLQYKLKLKAEMNLLISKYQHLSEIDTNQVYQQPNNSQIPTYHQAHQPQQNLYSSDYNNQILSDAYIQNQSTNFYFHQNFSQTQPTTSSLIQQNQPLQYNQSNTTVTSDTSTHDYSKSTSTNSFQRSPYDLSSTHP